MRSVKENGSHLEQLVALGDVGRSGGRGIGRDTDDEDGHLGTILVPRKTQAQTFLTSPRCRSALQLHSHYRSAQLSVLPIQTFCNQSNLFHFSLAIPLNLPCLVELMGALVFAISPLPRDYAEQMGQENTRIPL